MIFLKLSAFNSDHPVFLRVDDIRAIEPDGDGTAVWGRSGDEGAVIVRESTEEVMNLLLANGAEACGFNVPGEPKEIDTCAQEEKECTLPYVIDLRYPLTEEELQHKFKWLGRNSQHSLTESDKMFKMFIKCAADAAIT